MGLEDSPNQIKTDSHSVSFSGDALDYICAKYCNAVGVMWCGRELVYEDVDGQYETHRDFLRLTHDYRRYFEANQDFLEKGTRFDWGHSQEYIDEMFDFLLDLLSAMYGRARFLPLHAVCHGILCRPWNTIVLNKVMERVGDQAAHETDNHGELPLHIFLESCRFNESKAIERGYVKDADDYEKAINHMARVVLNANPGAALIPNSDDRLPIHVALTNNCVPNDLLVNLFINPFPRTVRVRDTHTGFYPFVTAAVGESANLEMSYVLLRRDPALLKEFDES